MNKITMICEEEDSKTTIERTIEKEDADIYFAGRAFYEFLKGMSFSDNVITKIVKIEDLYD